MDAFELPKEVVLNLPLISLTGHEELLIENYKGIIEYTDERLRVNTSAGVIRVEGRGLYLKLITSESMTINGNIMKIEFIA